jgi:CRP/FNR family cyclic AMP-dependent transcriptional regulator
MLPPPSHPSSQFWHPNSFLGQLSPATRTALLRTGISRTYQNKETLLYKGDESRHVLILVAGKVRVTADSNEGREALLAIRIEGDLVGELACLDDQPRSATVSVVTSGGERAAVRVIGQRSFRAFLRNHSDAGLAISRSVSAKLRWSTKRRIDFTQPVPIRLARVLYELAQQYGRLGPAGVIVLEPFTQSDWAGFICASLQSVQIAFQQLREAGLVRTLYRQVVVVDLDGLRDFAKLEAGIPPPEMDGRTDLANRRISSIV